MSSLAFSTQEVRLGSETARRQVAPISEFDFRQPITDRGPGLLSDFELDQSPCLFLNCGAAVPPPILVRADEVIEWGLDARNPSGPEVRRTAPKLAGHMTASDLRTARHMTSYTAGAIHTSDAAIFLSSGRRRPNRSAALVRSEAAMCNIA